MWKKCRLTWTHLRKQKRNFKNETNLKNNFQNTSQQHAHLEASLSLEGIFRQLSNISFLFQVWEHTPQRLLRHKQSGLCLDSKDVKSGEHVTSDNCDNSKYSQIWQFSLTMV